MATMARVPHRRETGLDAHAVLGFVLELLQFAFGAQDLRMIVRIAQGFQRDERIEHRRENRGQAVRAFESFQHPLLGLLQGAFAEGMNAVFREPFGELVQPIQPEEKIAPGEPFRDRARSARSRSWKPSG